MISDAYPVLWTGRHAVVPLPEHIGPSNAGLIREELLSVINRGATTLIADMTATISCDHAGADAVARAFQQAVIGGTELRLVVTAQIVRRVLAINGLDGLVSIYPSLEAATAARPLAPILAPVAGSSGARTNSHAPHRRPRGPTTRFPSADGIRAAVTGAVVWQLVNALQDGVALADNNGAVALANTRLEQMFGYHHAEPLGQPIEVLLPVDLEAAPGRHRARHAPAPRTRPMGAGARLVGLRKDGTMFPAEISLSSVTTAAGHFAVIVIRDITETRQAGEPADLAAAAVAAEQAHRGQELLDTTITSLLHVQASLQTAIDLPAELIRQRIAEALGHLDDTIREIRTTPFTIRHHGDPSSNDPSGHQTATAAQGRKKQVSRPPPDSPSSARRSRPRTTTTAPSPSAAICAPPTSPAAPDWCSASPAKDGWDSSAQTDEIPCTIPRTTSPSSPEPATGPGTRSRPRSRPTPATSSSASS